MYAVTSRDPEARRGGVKSRVLIVDDDAGMRETLQGMLSAAGYACEVVPDATAALDVVDHQVFDVVINEVRMDGFLGGPDLLDRVRQNHPSLPFIVITGPDSVRQAVDVLRRGAFECLAKPLDADDLRATLARALDMRPHPGESAHLSQPPAALGTVGLVGAGLAMRALRTTVDLVARSSAPVLVRGETGVGKEVVARAIHARSARGSRPIVAVNTSAVPLELLEAEIFGHTRGAFTGAVQHRRGILTEADGGTLILDEIGDMPVPLQAKLLRVLQFGEVRPVGSDRAHRVDVRVIAATHRNLEGLVREGRFREDLYYRLNVLPVFVPPLRDRREDIPALAAHFLAEALQRAPLSPVRSIGPEALAMLSDAPWPGNVRELASSVERAVVFGVDEMVDASHFFPGALEAQGRTAAQSWPFAREAPWTLRRLSRAYTEWVLAETGGNKDRAAQILGVDLSTLYRWQREEHPDDRVVSRREA